MTRIAVIGMGRRATGVVKCLGAVDPGVRLAAVADPDEAAVRGRLAEAGIACDDTGFLRDAEQLLRRAGEYDGLIIGTRCHLHTPLAVRAAETGLPLWLEKPVAVCRDQLDQLAAAYRGREQSVVVSFPLRVTPLFRKVRQIVRSGRLGTLNQIQASNYVPYGGVYFGTWYRDFNATGGLWLQKATHDFDYLNALVDAPPVAVTAMHSRNIYGGDQPEDLRCSACDRTDTCPESPVNQKARGDSGGMGDGDHACAFSRSIRHHDAGSALIRYADGTHAAYSQNFVTRRSAARRGARVTGYLATLEFDWPSETISIIEHHGQATEQFKVEAGDEDHAGGDAALCRNFLQVIRGEAPSETPLTDGLLSAAMCLTAHDAAEAFGASADRSLSVP